MEIAIDVMRQSVSEPRADGLVTLSPLEHAFSTAETRDLTIHSDDGTEETKDFDGPQVLAPEQALQWLRDKLPNPIDRSRARRRELNETLFELVREGVVNANVGLQRPDAEPQSRLALCLRPNGVSGGARFRAEVDEGAQLLATVTSTTRRQYAERLGVEDRTAQRQLRRFVEFGLIRRVGAGPAARYEVAR